MMPSSYPSSSPSQNPTEVVPSTTPFAEPSITPNISPSGVPSITPTQELTVIERYYLFGGESYDLCDVTYEEVDAQQNALLNFLNANPEQSGTVSFWVVNVTIANDKFDFAPYNGNEKCVSTNIGKTVIKALYIPGRPSASPSATLSPSMSISPTSNPSASDAPTVVHSIAPSILPSAVPSMKPSYNPSGSPSYAPTVTPSEMPIKVYQFDFMIWQP